MRKLLWVSLAVLFVASVAPNAHADTFTNYAVNFTLSGGSPAPSTATFVYDNTTATFTSADVLWNGITFNFLLTTYGGVNNPFTLAGANCIGAGTGAQATVSLLSSCQTTAGTTFLWGTGAFDPSGTYAYFDAYDAAGNNIYEAATVSTASTNCGQNPMTDCATGAFSASTVSTNSVPEPGAGFLTLLGIGSGWVMRKRSALGL
ncbi:MAG: PEP-CTERM sorting domain-containing protein [Terriglobales bacterium]